MSNLKNAKIKYREHGRIGNALGKCGTELTKNIKTVKFFMNEKTDKIEQCLRNLLSTIKAHECTCFSCDRDGDTYCDCLSKEAETAEKALNEK